MCLFATKFNSLKMDYVLIVFGVLFIIAGILGGVLPVLPGPPLSYIGLLLLHFLTSTMRHPKNYPKISHQKV
jgi:uncharacterized membrane protein YbaN (DUF454 family)